MSDHLNESETDEITQAFDQEVAAFERMKASLLIQYEGQYVAIYQGQVIANGDEKLKLLDEVRAQFGDIVCYIEKVAPDSLKTVRITSIWKVRS